MESILVATDFRPCSQPALELAFALAAAMGGKVHVVHAFTADRVMGGPAHAAEALDEARDRAETAMRRLTLARRAGGLLAGTRVEMGPPRSVVLRAAGALNADLVVIGRHACSARTTRGRVAEALLRNSRAHVLVAPGQDDVSQRLTCGRDEGAATRGLREDDPHYD